MKSHFISMIMTSFLLAFMLVLHESHATRPMIAKKRTIENSSVKEKLSYEKDALNAREMPPTEAKTTGKSRILSSSSKQSLENLRVKEKNPHKNVESSMRTVPPSRSNPTQNK
ncbi:tetratricopeptide repeat-containing protein [Striga asiatica]|uniref:Tetratricopeptide repeat-containing protein n=1 Tax=Striga asiatica TaxID=4170 RepID=A0A5A7R7C1_STRAF|nr:tetratricopeptide repeat-containing protein [Striga asiatica]